MAARDIMPWRAPLGGHTLTRTYDLLADETFHEGEVVRLDDTTGQLEMAADDPDVTLHQDSGGADAAVGVAAEPAEGMATDAAGTQNPDFAPRGVWVFVPDQEWITPYFSIADSEFDDDDFLHAYIGAPCGLMYDGTNWGISLAATNLQFRVTGILDARKQPIKDLTTDATYVTFVREVMAQMVQA